MPPEGPEQDRNSMSSYGSVPSHSSGTHSGGSRGPSTIDASDASVHSNFSHGPPTIDSSDASIYSGGSRGPPTIDPSVTSGTFITGSRGKPTVDSSDASGVHSRGDVGVEDEHVDDEGRCRKHPHIRLRKKKMLGGWKVLLANCPDCCAEEMRRLRLEGSAAKDAGGARGDGVGARRGGGGHARRPDPPIVELNIRTRDHDDSDAESSSSQASEITYGSRPSFSQQPVEDAPRSAGAHRVARMPFTDAYGDKGWFTGEVASGSGLPHGQGTMLYCDGRIRAGWWSNGLAGGAPNNSRGGAEGDAAPLGRGGPAPQGRGSHPMNTSGMTSGRTHDSSGASVSRRNIRNTQQQPRPPMMPPQPQKQPPPPQQRGWWSNGLAGGAPKNVRGRRGGTVPMGEEGPAPHWQELHHNTHNSPFASSLNHAPFRQPEQPPMMPPTPQKQLPPPQPRPPALARDAVFNLHWTNLQGQAGYYTGEIDETGEPHGMGSMRYLDNKTVLQGEWYHGELERQMHQHGIVNVGADREGGGSRSGGRSTGRSSGGGGGGRNDYQRAARVASPPRWGEEARRRSKWPP